jgi:hypothetical protein
MNTFENSQKSHLSFDTILYNYCILKNIDPDFFGTEENRNNNYYQLAELFQKYIGQNLRANKAFKRAVHEVQYPKLPKDEKIQTPKTNWNKTNNQTLKPSFSHYIGTFALALITTLSIQNLSTRMPNFVEMSHSNNPEFQEVAAGFLISGINHKNRQPDPEGVKMLKKTMQLEWKIAQQRKQIKLNNQRKR